MEDKDKRIYNMVFGEVYPHYVSKAERKGQSKGAVDDIICWLTGYDKDGIERQVDRGVSMEVFFEEAPSMNPDAVLIKGSICGYKVQEITEPLMKKIRWMDKLVDEVAKGKGIEKIIKK